MLSAPGRPRRPKPKDTQRSREILGSVTVYSYLKPLADTVFLLSSSALALKANFCGKFSHLGDEVCSMGKED